MDWIERWLGVSPDGGDGSLELLLVLLVVTIVPMFSRRVRSSLKRRVAAFISGVLGTP
jgi:hypothetical protein